MWVVAAVVVLAGLAALGLLLLTRLSVAGDGEIWKKVEHIERLREEPPFDAVFVSHSMPLCALDPVEIGRSSGGLRTYNASLSTLFVEASRHWMSQVVVPNLRPKVVFLAIWGCEFNEGGSRKDFMERFILAQDARVAFELGGPLRRLKLLLTDRGLLKYLVRRLAGGAKEPMIAPEDRSQLGPLGEEHKHDDRALNTTERLHEALRDGVYGDYVLSDAQLAQVRDFVRDMRALGSEVGVVRLVAAPDAVKYFPRGQADYDEVWARLRPILGELSVPVFEVADRSPFDESCFADVMHMNGRGKQLFSREIGAALGAHFRLEHAG